VRLPRDWLGPRDELIPFGPSAYARESEAASTLGGHPGPGSGSAAGEHGSGPSLTQDDFWGGDLASIPRPVVGPESHDGRRRPPPSAGAAASADWELAGLGPRGVPAALDGLMRAADVLGIRVRAALARLLRDAHPRRWRRPVAALVASACVALVIGVVINALATARHVGPSGSFLGPAAASLSGVPDRLAQLASIRMSSAAAPRPRRHPAARHRCACAHRRTEAAAAHSGGPQVRYTSTSTSAAGGAGTYVHQSTTATNSSHFTSHAATTSSNSASQPAFGANGLLGPGSSRNG
jgi:hypothetical protein